MVLNAISDALAVIIDVHFDGRDLLPMIFGEARMSDEGGLWGRELVHRLVAQSMERRVVVNNGDGGVRMKQDKGRSKYGECLTS